MRVRVRRAGGARYAHALAEQRDNRDGAIHADSHAAQLVGRFRPALAARLATEALGAGRGLAVRAAVLMLANDGYHGEGFPGWELSAYDSVLRLESGESSVSIAPTWPCKAEPGFFCGLCWPLDYIMFIQSAVSS